MNGQGALGGLMRQTQADYMAGLMAMPMAADTRPMLDRVTERRDKVATQLDELNSFVVMLQSHEGVAEIMDMARKLGF